MTRAKITRTMRFVVPVLAIVLIGGDFILASCVGDAATYTAVIRSWIYAWPSFGMFLAGAMGALWAHFFWTPGAEIESIKADLRRRGVHSFTVSLYPKGVNVAAHTDIASIATGTMAPTEREAWRALAKRLHDFDLENPDHFTSERMKYPKPKD